MAAVDSSISALLEALNINHNVGVTATAATQANASGAEQVQNAMVETYKQSASDAALIDTAKQTAALHTQDANIKAANIFGTNLDLQTNAITGLAATRDQAYQDKQAALAEITRKDSVGIFDNPVEYLMNKFTVNSDIAKYNQASINLETAGKMIDQINTNTQTQAATNKLLDESLSATTIAASARRAAVQATAASASAQENAIKYNQLGIDAVKNQSEKDINNMYLAFSANKADEQLQIAHAHLDLERQAAEERIREFNLRLDKNNVDLAVDNSYGVAMNRGRAARGAQPLDSNALKVAIAQLKSGSPLAKANMDDLILGQKMIDNPGLNLVATSPANLSARIEAGTSLNLPPIQQPILDVVSQARKDWVDNPMNAGIKDPEVRADGINKLAMQRINDMKANVDPSSKNNIFNIGSLDQIAASSDAVKNLSVYQKVLAPVLTPGTNGMAYAPTPEQTVALIARAVGDGVITLDDAQRGVTIFQAGNSLNAAARNFTGLGIPVPTTFNTKVEGTVRDLASQSGYSTALQKMLARDIADRFQGGVGMDEGYRKTVELKKFFDAQPNSTNK